MSSIKRMLLLAKTITRTTDFGISFGRKKKDLNKKGTNIVGIIILGLVFLYFAGIILFISVKFFDFLKLFGMQSAMLGYSASLFSFIIFFFGIFYIISVFYFTSDIEHLLSLPFNAWEIIGGKFLSVIIYEYITTSLVLIPFFVYGFLNGEGILFYLYSIVIMLLLPIIPLALTAVIIMPIMRFVKFARNKDLFNMISGVLVMAIALSFNFYFQSMFTNETDLGNVVNAGGEKLVQITSAIFPGTVFAGQSLASASNINGLIYIVLLFLACVIAFSLVLLLANFLYLKAATAVSSSNASHKKLNKMNLAKNFVSTPSFFTYMKKDILILIRTPIFFMNNVLLNFIWPIVIFIAMYRITQSQEQGNIQLLIKSINFSDFDSLGKIFFIIFAVSIFIGGMNGITSSALSREGNCFNIMKFIPMSYFKQIIAKISVGFMFSFICIIIGLGVVCYFTQPPIWIIVLSIIICIPALIFTNLCGIIFELFWPKLHWDNEQKAVKQNLNVVLGMFLPIGLAIPIVIFGFLVPMNFYLSYFLLLAVGCILDVIVIVILKTIVPMRMRNIVY